MRAIRICNIPVSGTLPRISRNHLQPVPGLTDFVQALPENQSAEQIDGKIKDQSVGLSYPAAW